MWWRRSEVDHLRELMMSMFSARDKGVEAALASQQREVAAARDAADKGIEKVERATEKRFDGVNEFRQTLSDQAAMLMPRAEALQRANANAEKIDGLAARLDRLEAGLTAGRVATKETTDDRRASTGTIVAVIGLGLALAVATMTAVLALVGK